jgi:hypothetical protein
MNQAAARVRARGATLRVGACVAGAAIAVVAMASTAGAKTVTNAEYAATVCGEVANVLAPLTALQAVDATDVAAYQSQAVTRLDEAAEAAADAREALAGVQPKSGGKKAAKTFDRFLRLRAAAYADASDEMADGDPTDADFVDQVDAFADVLEGAPLGLASPFTQSKALSKAFTAETTCEPMLATF